MSLDNKAAAAVDEFPASRPGVISYVLLVVIIGTILIADNYTMLKGIFGAN